MRPDWRPPLCRESASDRPARSKAASVSGARNLPGWDGAFPLGEALQRALGAPVKLGNDVQVATGAEHMLGAGRGSARCSASSGARASAAA